MSVESVASFEGNDVTLGRETGDFFEFGALTLRTPNGTSTISEDGSLLLTGDSDVLQLDLFATGTIGDSVSSDLDVGFVARFDAPMVVIGDLATDSFNAQSLRFNTALTDAAASSRSVQITENSDLVLSGVSLAGSASLTSIGGTVTDDVNADTFLANVLAVTGTLANLGTSTTDSLQIGGLTFNTTGNTNINANSPIFLTGNSNSGDQLILTSTGNITDAPTSNVTVANAASLTGVDIVIGELAGDTFDILNTNNLFVNASGVNNVTEG